MDAVTVSASFCFCVTFIVLLVEPALMITDAERSSGSVFSFVVIVIVAFPALPLVGDTLHHESARTFTAEAVQAVEALKVTFVEPPFVGTTGLRSVPDVNSTFSSFVGSCLPPSSPLGSLFSQAMVIIAVNNKSKISLIAALALSKHFIVRWFMIDFHKYTKM